MEDGQSISQIQSAISKDERIIRSILLIGFVTMLAIEAWLVIQVWNLWA